VISEIDIWRVANLMLKRHGAAAQVESARRADELAAARDAMGVAFWLRVVDTASSRIRRPAGRCTDLATFRVCPE
jgi:hypothetical protein